MQCQVIEYARNVAGLQDAHSSEFAFSPHPVIDLMDEQQDVSDKGGTMRLGLYPCKVMRDSLLGRIYDSEIIYERHRHRYEFNNEYRDILQSHGLVLCGISPDEQLVEVVEAKDHPWYIGTQFHPEFRSRPNRPHPILNSFIAAAVQRGQK